MLEGKKISELDQIDTLSLGSSFPVLDKGATKRIAFSALLNKIENELPESDIDKVKDDVEKLKVKTESINTLTAEMEAVKDQVSGVDEMVQGQNATIRNCVSAVEGLEQTIEQTHFDDVLALEEQVQANTTNIELKQDALTQTQLNAVNSGITEEILQRLLGKVLTPAGTIQAYAGANSPQGYLLCQGQAISKSEYAELYLAIGDLYSNDETAEGFFNVPDLRECVPVGIGTNSTNSIASHDVYELGQFKDDQLQGHSHDLEWSNGLPNHSIGGLYSGGGSYNSSDQGSTKLTIKGVKTDGENGTPRAGTTTHGKQIGVNYIIKY